MPVAQSSHGPRRIKRVVDESLGVEDCAVGETIGPTDAMDSVVAVGAEPAQVVTLVLATGAADEVVYVKVSVRAAHGTTSEQLREFLQQSIAHSNSPLRICSNTAKAWANSPA